MITEEQAAREIQAAIQCTLLVEAWVDGWHGPPSWWASEDEFEILHAVTTWRMLVDGHPQHWARWLRNGMEPGYVLNEIQRYVERGPW